MFVCVCGGGGGVFCVSCSSEWDYFPDSFLSIGLYDEGDWVLYVNFVYCHFSKFITSKRFPVESLGTLSKFISAVNKDRLTSLYPFCSIFVYCFI